jgi:hypothetical protein
MIRSVRSILVLLTLVAAAGCGTRPEVSTDFDPSRAEDLQSYRTYAWFPASPVNQETSRIVGGRVRTAVDEALRAKGYVQGPPDTVDFHVGWHTTTTSFTDYRALNNAYGYTWDHWGSAGYGTPAPETAHWPPGAIVIDIADARSNVLVWRGTILGGVASERDPAKRQELIEARIRDLFRGFPPPAR